MGKLKLKSEVKKEFIDTCKKKNLDFKYTKDEEDYAICRITNTPSFTQVANNVYDVSLDIVEVW